MKTNSLNIQQFANEMENPQQELLLNFFKFQGDMGLELIPNVVQAGCVALCLNGELELKLNEQKYTLKAGDLCVVFPDTIIQPTRKSADVDCSVLAANLEFIRNLPISSIYELYLTLRENPCISLSPEEKAIMLTYFEYIHLSYERKEFPYRVETTKQLLLLLCYEIAAIYQNGRRIKNSAHTYKENLFRNFMQLVSDEYATERRVNHYAEKLNITPKYLSATVKETSQKSAAEWINHFVITNAKLMLSTSPLTIQQISDKLNFPNPSFFTQYFKRATGKTPKEFRSNIK